MTGDNHIGLKYASYKQATILASSRITAFENMLQTANEENCALFAITGDLFENTYSVSKKEIKTLLDVLSCFNGTVVVLPGNHDYYDKDLNVWQYFKDVMSGFDNIMLLTDYRPYKMISGYVARIEHFCVVINEGIYDKNTFYALAHGYFDGEQLRKRIEPLIETKNRRNKSKEIFYNDTMSVFMWMENKKQKMYK